MKPIKTLYLLLITGTLYLVPCTFILSSCSTIDVYEKTAYVPGHKWSSSYKPSFTFDITDTTSPYQVFFIIRHSEKYSFTNIYINLFATLPGNDTALKIQRDLVLATPEHGWLGEGMDDLYERRAKLGEPQRLKAGTYTFTLEQIMREDPLANVFNVGIRVEKQP